MTKEEAITILENGEWWEIISGVLPCDDAERMELQQAVHVAVSALRARKATAKLDRSRWEGCWNCNNPNVRKLTLRHGREYCPGCGKPLTAAAWAELERRINDGATD